VVNFASDNNSGVCAEVMAAIVDEAGRFGPAYGGDDPSARLTATLAEVFEHEVTVLPVATGTAANSLCLAATNPVWGGVVCHEMAHIQVDECAAPTVIGGGLTLHPVGGDHGRFSAGTVHEFLDTRRDSGVHTVPITGMSITQVTETGTRYCTDDVAAIAELAHSRGMVVHLDGARFANAVAGGQESPADLTWRAGVDLMSLGATKGGALIAEAVVVFTDCLRDDPARLRKRVGHLLSKQRFVAAQFEAWLADGAWLRHAAHANALAARLGEGLAGLGVDLAHPVEANMVFAMLDPAAHRAATSAGAEYYVEAGPGDLVEARLVTSWSSTTGDVDSFLAAVASAASPSGART
jgi:threonine aldolase